MEKPAIRILYHGKLALTILQSATRYGIGADAMRHAIVRAKQAGLLNELPEALDGRTKLYLATDLDKVMKQRPRRGPNVRKRLAEATAPPRPRPPADYVPYGERKPCTVAATLDALTGPTTGVVELPHHINWSGTPQRNLDAPNMLASVYETVLREASTVADLETWLNRDKLIELWPTLFLPPKVRRLWDDRFPELLAASRTADTKDDTRG